MAWRDTSGFKRVEVYLSPETMSQLDEMCKVERRSRAQVITMLIEAGSVPVYELHGNDEILSLLREVRSQIEVMQALLATNVNTSLGMMTFKSNAVKNTVLDIPVDKSTSGIVTEQEKSEAVPNSTVIVPEQKAMETKNIDMKQESYNDIDKSIVSDTVKDTVLAESLIPSYDDIMREAYNLYYKEVGNWKVIASDFNHRGATYLKNGKKWGERTLRQAVHDWVEQN